MLFSAEYTNTLMINCTFFKYKKKMQKLETTEEDFLPSITASKSTHSATLNGICALLCLSPLAFLCLSEGRVSVGYKWRDVWVVLGGQGGQGLAHKRGTAAPFSPGLSSLG